MLLYFAVSFPLAPFSAFTLSQIVTICWNLDESFSGHRYLSQTAWTVRCANRIAPSSASLRPWPIRDWSMVTELSCFLLFALPHSAMWEHELRYKSKPCAVWTWKYTVKWGTSADTVVKNGPEAVGLSGRQTEEIPFIYLFIFNFLRQSMYLMAPKVVWFPRQAA